MAPEETGRDKLGKTMTESTNRKDDVIDQTSDRADQADNE